MNICRPNRSVVHICHLSLVICHLSVNPILFVRVREVEAVFLLLVQPARKYQNFRSSRLSISKGGQDVHPTRLDNFFLANPLFTNDQ
jgi:hypothetical protein